jgi:diguanylate cyclase (GGDEF)-like protein
MKLLDRLLTPAKSGIDQAVSRVVELAIIGAGSFLGSLILTFGAAHLPGLTDTFWASKRFALYEVIIWLAASAVAATLITFSVMRRKLSHIEDQAKELSQLDPATGLLNLRALNEELPRAVRRAQQARQPLTMVIFDIDGFKEINTLVGHDRANVILKAVAAALLPRAPDKAFRYPENVDRKTPRMVFRYGGDEFIILAFNTTVIGGTNEATGKPVFNGSAMAKALQGNVWGVDYPDLADKRKDRSGSPKLTVSAGIADINPSLDPDDTTAALTNRAEFALIEAKRLNKAVTPLVESFKGTVVSYNGDQYRVL